MKANVRASGEAVHDVAWSSGLLPLTLLSHISIPFKGTLPSFRNSKPVLSLSIFKK